MRVPHLKWVRGTDIYVLCHYISPLLDYAHFLFLGRVQMQCVIFLKPRADL